MCRKRSVMYIIGVVLFLCGVGWSMLSTAICWNENEQYTEIQPESFTPDVIETILHDEDLHQIYVCYNTANYVNVYSESGEFLWAVATPYLRNSGFDLVDDTLVIYDDDAYVYNAANGAFLRLDQEENLDISFTVDDEYTDEFEDGEFYFDDHQVYQGNADGTLRTIVARPWWHRLFNFEVGWGLGALGGILIGIAIFIRRRKSYTAVKQTVKFQTRKANVIANYFKITSIVHIVYAVLDVIVGFFGGFLCIGIIPLGLHFIVSNIVLYNMLNTLSVSQKERAVLEYWKACELGTFVVAFGSVIVAAAIAGG